MTRHEQQVKMEQLRELFRELCFTDVRNYIQTGNIFFQTSETSRAKLTRKIEQLLCAALDYEVPNFLRTFSEVESALQFEPSSHLETADTRYAISHHFTLSDSDTAQLEFGGQIKGKDYQITILVVEDLPQIFINQDGKVILNETVKSIDDLKIFLEERLYTYLEV